MPAPRRSRNSSSLRQVNLRLKDGGQLDLSPFRSVAQPLQGHPVRGQVDAGFLLELGNHPFQDRLVEVVAAQEGVSIG